MNILLTDEEIEESSQVDMFLPNGEVDPDCGYLRGRQQVARAQLKRVAEWGNEPCPHPSTFDGQRLTKKKNCPDCWQVLLKEAGL